MELTEAGLEYRILDDVLVAELVNEYQCRFETFSPLMDSRTSTEGDA